MRGVTCASDSTPASAQACRIGAITRIRGRVVSSSPGLRRGGVAEPCRMTSNQMAICSGITDGLTPCSTARDPAGRPGQSPARRLARLPGREMAARTQRPTVRHPADRARLGASGATFPRSKASLNPDRFPPTASSQRPTPPAAPSAASAACSASRPRCGAMPPLSATPRSARRYPRREPAPSTDDADGGSSLRERLQRGGVSVRVFTGLFGHQEC
jgi:hypothetical protein